MNTKRPRNFDSQKPLTPFNNIDQFLKLTNPDKEVQFNKNERIKVDAKQNISIPKVYELDLNMVYGDLDEKEQIYKRIKHDLGYIRIGKKQNLPDRDGYESTDYDKQFFDEYTSKQENKKLKLYDFERMIIFFEEQSVEKTRLLEDIRKEFTPIHPLYQKVDKNQFDDLYGYWKSRREFYKRPLQRKFMILMAKPGVDDNNPHLAYRPQPNATEKMKTRKQNDQENLIRKFQSLGNEFQQHQLIIESIRAREAIKFHGCLEQNDNFMEQLYKIDPKASFKYNGIYQCDSFKQYQEQKQKLDFVRNPVNKENQPINLLRSQHKANQEFLNKIKVQNGQPITELKQSKSDLNQTSNSTSTAVPSTSTKQFPQSQSTGKNLVSQKELKSNKYKGGSKNPKQVGKQPSSDLGLQNEQGMHNVKINDFQGGSNIIPNINPNQPGDRFMQKSQFGQDNMGQTKFQIPPQMGDGGGPQQQGMGGGNGPQQGNPGNQGMKEFQQQFSKEPKQQMPEGGSTTMNKKKQNEQNKLALQQQKQNEHLQQMQRKQQNFLLYSLVASVITECKKNKIRIDDLKFNSLNDVNKLNKLLQSLKPPPAPKPVPAAEENNKVQENPKDRQWLNKTLIAFNTIRQKQNQKEPEQQQHKTIKFNLYKQRGRSNQHMLVRTFDDFNLPVKMKEKRIEEYVYTQLNVDGFKDQRELYETTHISKKLDKFAPHMRYDEFDFHNNVLREEPSDYNKEKLQKSDEVLFDSVLSNLLKQKDNYEKQKEDQQKREEENKQQQQQQNSNDNNNSNNGSGGLNSTTIKINNMINSNINNSKSMGGNNNNGIINNNNMDNGYVNDIIGGMGDNLNNINNNDDNFLSQLPNPINNNFNDIFQQDDEDIFNI